MSVGQKGGEIQQSVNRKLPHQEIPRLRLTPKQAKKITVTPAERVNLALTTRVVLFQYHEGNTRPEIR